MKGVYPYEYMASMEKMRERSLPPKQAFKSTLKQEDISDSDYEHAQNVFSHFEMILKWWWQSIFILLQVFPGRQH